LIDIETVDNDFQNQWANMFCGIISRAAIHQVLEVGQTEIFDGACQVVSKVSFINLP